MQTAFSTSTEQVLIHLLLQIAVILFVSRLVGTLFRLGGQSQSVGEILAGVMMGPSLFGHFVPGAFEWLFHPDGPALLPYFSHIGLVLALFLIGMEFDFGAVRAHVGKVVAIAAATLVGPLAAGALLASWLWTLAPGDKSFSAYALLLGMVMAITAIPIMGRILIELGLSRTRVGVLAISAGVVKDLFTWFLLAIVAGIAKPPVDATHVLTMIAMTGLLSVGMLTLGRKALALAQRTFGWVDDRPSDALVTYLLVTLLLLAAATSAIGVFAIFGAFLAGATVSSDRKLAHAVSSRFHDLTINLFLPIFFTYTGLRADLSQLHGSLWGAMLVFTLVGTLMSGGVATLIARWRGMSGREALVMGALVNTPGLMILILLNVGLDLGVIPATLFSAMVGHAMIRNLLAVPIVRWAARGGLPAASESDPVVE